MHNLFVEKMCIIDQIPQNSHVLSRKYPKETLIKNYQECPLQILIKETSEIKFVQVSREKFYKPREDMFVSKMG